MPEPKPCPVCGGSEFNVEFRDTGSVAAFLICDECAEDKDTRGPLGQPCGTDEDAENEAILAWNHWVDNHSNAEPPAPNRSDEAPDRA
jgi:transcription elongation factor Elf1